MRGKIGQFILDVADTAPICNALDRVSLDRTGLRETALANDWKWFEFGSRTTLEYSEPVGYDSHPPELEDRISRQYSLPTPFVVEVPDSVLLPPRGIVIEPSGRFVLETSSLGNPGVIAQNLTLSLLSAQFPVRIRSPTATLECATPLVGSWTGGYFHWTCDWLTRIHALTQYEREYKRKPTVIVPANMSEWMRDSLLAAGIPEERWHPLEERLGVERLVIPWLPRITSVEDASARDVYYPDALHWIRDRARSNVDGDGRNRPDKIYISRDDATVRRVINERELVNQLQDRGFQRIVLSELSFVEQVELFSGVDVVVGPHGAGMTNALYAEDTTLVECFGSRVTSCYLTITEHIDVDYSYFCADPVDGDMYVDPVAFCAHLDSLGV